MADSRDKTKLETITQIGGLVVGVLAIVITVYFSFRSERDKEITVTYLSKRSLVSIDGPRPSVHLEVSVDGKQILVPWLVSVRFENTGNIPIEERDIESHAKISFSRSRIVAAEILKKNQPNVYGLVRVEASDLYVEHKLLNPGDWMAFDVLFDGEPDLPPNLTLRISGVQKPIQIVASSESKRLGAAIFFAPAPVIFLSFAISSIVAAIFFIAAIISFVQSRKKNASPSYQSQDFERSIQRNMMGLRPHELRIRTIYSAIGEPRIDELLSGDLEMRRYLELAPSGLYQALEIDQESAGEALAVQLKIAFRDALAFQLYLMSPVGVDKILQEKFQNIDVTSLSVQSISDLARHEYGQQQKTPAKQKIDSSKVVGGVLLFVSSFSLALLLGGVWKLIAGN